MNVSSFFASVERALFDLATWVILIPKTLYRVLTRPEAVPDYVRGELAEDKAERFEGSLSPVFLYLLLALGPLLLIQVVELPRAPIEGEPSGVVDSSYVFSMGLRSNYPDQIRVEWTVSEGPNEVNLVESCYETAAGAVADASADLGSAHPVGCAEQLFWVLLEIRDYDVDAVRDSVGAVYGDSLAGVFAEFWCSTPPGIGCEGHEAWTLFAENSGRGVDAARDSVALSYGDSVAREFAVYWCAPPAGEGCEGSVVENVWNYILHQVDTKNLAVDDVVAAMLAGRFKGQEALVRAVEEYWCAPPSGRGCTDLEAYEPGLLANASLGGGMDEGAVYERVDEALFGLVTDEEYGVDQAVQVLEGVYERRHVLNAAVFWCAPPAGDGCEGSSIGAAWTEFMNAVTEQGRSAAEARVTLGGWYGDDIAGEIFEYWCAPPAGYGCEDDEEWAMEEELAEPWLEALPPVECYGSSDVVSFGEPVERDSLTCTWNAAETYSIRAMVYDSQNSELVDVSRDHAITIAASTEGGSQEAKKDLRGTGTDSHSGPGFSDVVKDPDTMLMALALLAFPLILALLTVVFRVPELTQAAIKPAFYIQCLYLAPFALAVWIPGLLINYWPEFDSPGADLPLWSVLLILVLLVWLLSVQVNFIAAERGTSKLRAFGILVAPVFLVVLVILAAAFASAEISRFDAIEHAAYILIVLLFLPLVINYVGKVFRGLFGRRREAA